MNVEEVISLLETGRFRNRPIKGKLIETHISWVILSSDYVFKIKKPMKYSFLDFSTFSKRKFFCHREVELNRRLAPDIYLDVLPIRRNGRGIFIGQGTGKVIDHVVWMKRLQSAKEMDRVMIRGGLTQLHMDRLAKKIADFHRNADVVLRPFSLAVSKAEFNDIGTVEKWVGEHAGEEYSERIRNAIVRSNKYLKGHQGLLKSRIASGYQRDVHGDFHARNIFLYRDPVIFDCIEFNDVFRQIDVLKEVGYFCMDLDAFDNAPLGNYFIRLYNQMFPAINSDDEWRLFYYYKCYRANVRAKVNALRAIQATNQKDLEQYTGEVKKYLKLMGKYFVDIDL